MNLLGICTLLLIADVVFSETACKNSKNPCECILPNNTVIDLSSVGLEGKPRFYEIFNPNCSETYSYNPCFPFVSPDTYTTTDPTKLPCVGASACVKGFGGTNGSRPEEHAIGLQKSAIFGIEKGQIYISYTVSDSQKMLRVYLNCVNQSSDLHQLTLNDISICSSSAEPIVLTLSSKCACANGCQQFFPKDDAASGLSTGSKLLIVFFTILLAYLIIGIVWNYCNGSQGMELIPNIEFWNGLPTLIMEGVVFTCSCCGRPRSYGEV